MTEPLLACEDLRVDVDSVPACDGLTLRTSGSKTLVLGASRVVFEATCALRPAARGTITVRGAPPARAVADRVVAGVPLDPPLPAKWNAIEYATWSARLAGLDADEARQSALRAAAKLELGPLATSDHARLPPHAKRAVAIASALATGAEVIALEDPLAGLPEEVWRTFAKILVLALAERSWIVFASRMPITSPLALAADEAIVVSGPRVDAQGAPAAVAGAQRRYVARLHGALDALEARLRDHGAKIETRGAGTHVVFDLGESMTTADLMRLCVESAVTVVELLPVARALA